MTLNQINEFVVLAQTRSFHRTAEILYISQSSLSKHIQSLEVELGKPLFERTRRRVELSLFGQSFLPYATQIANIERNFNRTFLNTATIRESITLGVSLTIGTDVFSELTSEILVSHPESSVRFITGTSESLLADVVSGSCDVMVTGVNMRSPAELPNGVISKILASGHLVAIMPKLSPLAEYKTIRTEMLSGFPYIHLGDEINFDGGFGTPVICVNDLGTALDLVSKNYGYTIISEFSANRIRHEDIAVIALEVSPLTETRAFCLEASLEKPIVRDTFNFI